jgi:sulfatase modifying factor 1
VGPVDSGEDGSSDASGEGPPDARADASDAGSKDGSGMDGGAPASCVGLALTCGPRGDANCCATNAVPGGTYNREANLYEATVSAFRLDSYEVTVGRFRKFVAEYPRNQPSSGAGKNPNDPDDTGWNAVWNAAMPATAAALSAAVKCDSKYQPWDDVSGAHESRPINCISWYEAYAFCIWDGGRLPTEAEWQYAAWGGSEQRRMPWGTGPFDDTYASYWAGDCLGDGRPGCTVTDLVAVGSKSPKGDGKWGQSDLAGNVWEWTVDARGLYPFPCSDCSNHTMIASPDERIVRGGSFFHSPGDGVSGARFNYNPLGPRSPFLGARCARAP